MLNKLKQWAAKDLLQEQSNAANKQIELQKKAHEIAIRDIKETYKAYTREIERHLAHTAPDDLYANGESGIAVHAFGKGLKLGDTQWLHIVKKASIESCMHHNKSAVELKYQFGVAFDTLCGDNYYQNTAYQHTAALAQKVADAMYEEVMREFGYRENEAFKD
jgi:hypothetical protein